ncbi:MAG: hypothetical protein ABSA83_13960 [Verrucomicrobiota bacterium]|jgi:hypothetical protein
MNAYKSLQKLSLAAFFMVLFGPVEAGAQTGPIITQDLSDQTVLAGNYATLSVKVSGTGPFTYQWQENGTNIPNGIMTTVAGFNGSGYSGDGGAATNAMLSLPHSLTLDVSGNILFADTDNNRIREVSSNGIITTVAGGGDSYPGDGGAATNAILENPNGVAVDAYGNLFIADTSHSRIRKVNIQGPTFLVTNFYPAATNYDVVVTSPYGSVTSSVFTVTGLLPPQNLSASLIPGQGVEFQFTGTPTNAYVLQAAGNLVPPINWQPVVTNFTDINGNWTFTDTRALTNTAGFYRAMLP